MSTALPNGGLIRGKILRPSLPERLVQRPRLDRRIADLIADHRVVVVTATPGAGKTTALCCALSGHTTPVAWLTLDDTDAAPGRLLSYLEAALGEALPDVAGVATRALAAGIQHAEAAGLLVEAVGERQLVVVVDELERLGPRRPALAVIESMTRYAPPGVRLVLAGRRDVPLRLSLGPMPGSVASLGEADLAFTTEEAALALAAMPAGDPSMAEAAIEATGGWVTGVLFQAWRAPEHVAGRAGEGLPLHSYLANQILADLPEVERDFLVSTSLLDEVTAERAELLDVPDAAATLDRLYGQHLPATWERGGLAMRCHPCFRDYLLDRLQRRERERVRDLRIRYGTLLEDDGLLEEATEAYLAAGQRDSAARTAETSIGIVLERLDYEVAERWLRELGEDIVGVRSALTTAELMLAVGREEYRRGALIADRLAARNMRDEFARQSPRAAAMMAWCYFHQCRLSELEAVLNAAEAGPELMPVRYLLTLVDERETLELPAPTGGPLDGLLIRLHYWRGHFSELSAAVDSRWGEAVVTPWRIAALRAIGETERALTLYEEARSLGWAAVGLHAVVAGELFMDLGRADEARAALDRGRAAARRSGSLIWEMFNRLAEAKLNLRLLGDPATAKALLDDLERQRAARRYGSTAEQLDTWYGLAQLRLGENESALGRLRAAVASMQRSGRFLELPTAAVYLAEAEWRAGHEDQSDAAADVALDAARRQGTNHVLFLALGDFPAVLSRRLDAEAGTQSPWHTLGRAMLARAPRPGVAAGARVELAEYGDAALLVDGVEVRPRIFKTYELVALLAAIDEPRVDRSRLLDALFDGRADESSRAYLRQTVHQLRLALPADVKLGLDGAWLVVGPNMRITSQSTEVERLLHRALSQEGGARLASLVEAIALTEGGDYLPRAKTAWAAERRDQLERLTQDARFEAAELSHAQGRLTEAQALLDSVVERDPYRESAWRLQMQVASELGADDRVIDAYRRCEAALDAIGASPSSSTRRLLQQLRR